MVAGLGYKTKSKTEYNRALFNHLSDKEQVSNRDSPFELQ